MEIELVGRDEELAAIESWLDEPDVPVLLLEGEAGIGKTTLWRAAVDETRARLGEIGSITY